MTPQQVLASMVLTFVLAFVAYCIFAAVQGLWDILAAAETPAWCSGCDELQPTASMDFTKSGLYWCDLCRHPDKVINPKHSHDIADNLGCMCWVCQDREKMQQLAKASKLSEVESCYGCGKPADFSAYGAMWCNMCAITRGKVSFTPGAQF